MKKEITMQFEKSMEIIGSLIDWSDADICVWIKFQAEIIKCINRLNIDTADQVIKDGRKLMLELEANLNCSLFVCNLVWQTLDALVCKYMRMHGR